MLPEAQGMNLAILLPLIETVRGTLMSSLLPTISKMDTAKPVQELI